MELLQYYHQFLVITAKISAVSLKCQVSLGKWPCPCDMQSWTGLVNRGYRVGTGPKANSCLLLHLRLPLVANQTPTSSHVDGNSNSLRCP